MQQIITHYYLLGYMQDTYGSNSGLPSDCKLDSERSEESITSCCETVVALNTSPEPIASGSIREREDQLSHSVTPGSSYGQYIGNTLLVQRMTTLLQLFAVFMLVHQHKVLA